MPLFKRVFSRSSSFKHFGKFTSSIDTDNQDSITKALQHNPILGLGNITSTTFIDPVPVKEVEKLFGGELSTDDAKKLPVFILQTIDYLMKNGRETEGVFRHSTSEIKKQDLINSMNHRFAIEADPFENVTYEFGQSTSDEVIFASSVLKQYFRMLRQPVIPPKLYETFLSTAKCGSTDVEMRDMLYKAVRLLPPNNFELLKRVCELCCEIAKNHMKNKMTCENLSVCWQPNLLVNPAEDFLQQMKKTGEAQTVISCLFRDYEKVFLENPTTETEKPKVQAKKFFLGLFSQTTEEGLAVYKGEKSETGEKHGHGILMLPNGSIFDGQFKNNNYDIGRLVFTNGEKYEGRFEDGLPNDDNGCYYFSNMDTYVGNVVKGKITGKGEIKYNKDGSVYKGEVLNGKREGKGSIEYFDSNGRMRFYEGDWKDDKIEGHGSMIDITKQQIYVGDFKDGLYHGRGKLVSGKEQFSCEGHFEMGTIMDGSGALEFTIEHAQYEGVWTGGLFTGTAKFYSPKTRELEFEGQMVDSKKHGFGRLFCDDGSCYEGEFQQGEMTGKGVLLADERKYVGDFLYGMFHGKGELSTTFNNKTYLFNGEFSEHQPINGYGSLLLSRKSGDYLDGEFRDGHFFGKSKHTFEDGSYYEGDIANSLSEGNGVIYYADGTKFCGTFLNDEKHGSGTLYLHDTVVVQQYENGRLLVQEDQMGEQERVVLRFIETLKNKEAFSSLDSENISKALAVVKQNPSTKVLFDVLFQIALDTKY